MEWKYSKIPMNTSSKKFRDINQLNAILESTQEPVNTEPEQSRLINILDTDYKPVNLDKVYGWEDNLNQEHKHSLRVLL